MQKPTDAEGIGHSERCQHRTPERHSSILASCVPLQDTRSLVTLAQLWSADLLTERVYSARIDYCAQTLA